MKSLHPQKSRHLINGSYIELISFIFLPESSFICIASFVCVYSNSRNDVPRVAQRYVTIATHTRRRASVLVVFVVFACTCTVLPV